ncbi:hypothetical protein Gbem_1867 [Citrifermentans bemidjiense Bem]|uniref:Uncharacterized protein n=1 Tax=Citrifermentans bemidjiense (strain ATCC BAA-1014 / DSM 16622 / JCM 12645 / Bem) TaxID=404380 RepID=B5EB20_CITBB|nr:hypothetical protein [Citrifermentans bemidjiense]ACH38881.1 hypothetical protein Gbem_1867 [Citrifermentans bemidjiense Bem]
MECPKCRAKVGIMSQTQTVSTGAVHSIKCFICGYWMQTWPTSRPLGAPLPSGRFGAGAAPSGATATSNETLTAL